MKILKKKRVLYLHANLQNNQFFSACTVPAFPRLRMFNLIFTVLVCTFSKANILKHIYVNSWILFLGKTCQLRIWTLTSLHQRLRLREDLGGVSAVGLEDAVEALGGGEDVSFVLHGPRVVTGLEAQQSEILSTLVIIRSSIFRWSDTSLSK